MPETKMNRILHLRSSGGCYGAENVILNLAGELERMGCRNHIVCINNSKNPNVELVNEARMAGMLASPVNCRGHFDWKTVKTIRRILREERISIIHTHDYKSTVFGMFASIGMNVGRVATNHGWTNVNLKLHVYQFFEGIFYNIFDRVIAVSEAVKERISPFIFRRSKVGVVENGICLERKMEDGEGRTENQNPDSPLSIIHSPSSFIIGIVGRLSKEKGHTYLLKAFVKLLAETQGHKDTRTQNGKWKGEDGLSKTPESPSSVIHSPLSFKLLIVGDGPLEDDLKKQCREFGLSFEDLKCVFDPSSILHVPSSVIFTGVQNDMQAVYSALDVLVMPSLEEGLPMTLLEAMAAGVPVIATPVGEIPKIIRDGETGFLVESENVDSLVDALKRIMEYGEGSMEKIKNPSSIIHSPPSLQIIRENARKLVEEKYSARKMAEKYLKVYNEG